MIEQEKRENTIKGLECCTTAIGCYECPYAVGGKATNACNLLIDRDALALLKEQEPVEPKHEDDRPISPLRCGNCGAFILVTNDYKAKYCFECGREVRWT